MQIFITIMVLLVIRLISAQVRSRLKQKKIQRAFEEVFGNKTATLPSFKTGSAYGYPSFTITFKTEQQLKEAIEGGLTHLFIDSIKDLHSNIKSFEAEKAVFLTWEGRKP